MLTSRDIAVLRAVAVYYVLSRAQIQRLCFADDKNGRTTRRRLQSLVSAGFIQRHRLFVQHEVHGAPAPAYYPTRKGAEFLSEHFDDERFLRTNTDTPQPHLLYHWLAISTTHIALDEAVAHRNDVRIDAWFNEWEVVNKSESAPEKRFHIYTLIRESPRLIAAPDAAFMLSKDGFHKAFFLEQDRNTTGVERAIASKTPGYAGLAARNLHLRIFPEANVPAFTVLMIAPTARRRDALRRAMCQRKPDGAHLWKFADANDLTAEKFLTAPIFYACDGDPAPLIKNAAHNSSTDRTDAPNESATNSAIQHSANTDGACSGQKQPTADTQKTEGTL